MRVLHFVVGTSNLESSNGIDKSIYYLARSEAAVGAEVAAFCLSPKPEVPIPRVEVRNFAGPRGPFALPVAMREAILEWGPDIIHIHGCWLPPNLAMGRFARAQGIPYILTAHGNLSSRLLRRRPWLKIPYKVFCERPLYNRAAFVHAIADQAEIRAFGVTSPLVVAPNGFDPADVAPGAGAAEVEEAFPALAGKRFLLYLGRLDVEQKGLDLMLAAMALALRDHPELHLALAGSSWKDGRERLEGQAAALGIAEKVTFCGPIQGPLKFALMEASLAFLHPSRWEAGVPFAVLEALAVGKPCILTREADPLGVVERSGAAISCAGDASSLAAGFAKIAQLPNEDLEAMSAAARKLIRADFTWEKSARTLLDACEAVKRGESPGTDADFQLL